MGKPTKALTTEMNFTIADTETADLEGGICDIAVMKIDEDFNVLYQIESMIDPERPIGAIASGVHHITNKMVEFEPTMDEFVSINGNPFDQDDLVIAGHNIGFDCRVLSAWLPQKYKKLDTLKLARAIYPDAPDHKLQTLRYWLELDAGTAHRAMGDVVCCYSLLRRMCVDANTDLPGLLAMSAKPMTLDYKITFGKHRGEKLRDLPDSYVYWLLNKADSLDPDIREALEARLQSA